MVVNVYKKGHSQNLQSIRSNKLQAMKILCILALIGSSYSADLYEQQPAYTTYGAFTGESYSLPIMKTHAYSKALGENHVVAFDTGFKDPACLTYKCRMRVKPKTNNREYYTQFYH